jgi:DNA invertase Pin-like site-specific DNA recombinase
MAIRTIPTLFSSLGIAHLPDGGGARTSARNQHATPLIRRLRNSAADPAVLADILVADEVESGKLADQPEHTQALHIAKVTGATLLIAKLVRLSRNAAFLLTLRDSGGHFVAADMPEANDLTVGIMALVAEQEREAISRRT